MVVIYPHAKVQDQRSVGSEDRVETNGRTDGGNCITSQADAVGKYCCSYHGAHQHEEAPGVGT